MRLLIALLAGSGGSQTVRCRRYDAKLFTINFFSELPSGGESANLTHNGSINNIYQSDAWSPPAIHSSA